MKKIISLAGSLILITSATPVFAIEGLQIAVVSSNAVLTWPSLTDGSETFLIQYRSNLLSSAWTTLADFLPESGSNTTSFVDASNLVQFPVWSGGTNSGGSGNPMPPGMGDTNSLSGGNTNLWPVSTGFYRVVRDGVHLWGLTNGMVVSNELVTPIEFAVDNITDQIVGVTFYDENNSPLIGASASGSGNSWTLVWNTTMSFNGDYDIYAELDFASNNPVVSNPVSVTVNNVISFPNYFSRVYGNQMWIYAQTIPDAAYELDLYDENTNYLG